MNCKISASLMCANPLELNNILKCLKKNNIDYIHVDIMDGVFVKNFGVGTEYVKFLRQATDIPFDFHFMCKDSDNFGSFFDIRESDIVSVHYESSCNIQRTMEYFRKLNCRLLLAFNPYTSILYFDEIIKYIDGFNVLLVNPGYATQNKCKFVMDKIKRIGDLIKNINNDKFIFEIDGNVSPETADIAKKYGVNLFVAGTASIFKNNNYEHNIIELKNILR